MRIPNTTARFGEEIASNYLIKKGHKIIDRNFRKGYGEIDIISLHNNTLVFTEVKTRKTNLFGGAIEAVSFRKIKNLARTAQYYKILHPNLPSLLRIDAILIDIGDKTHIKHIENISGF
jgi:putative endonuclease